MGWKFKDLAYFCENGEARWRRMQIMPPMKGVSSSVAPALTSELDAALYDEIQQHIKLDANSAANRQAQVIIKLAKPSGTKAWNNLAEYYEKDNITLKKKIRKEIRNMKLINFPHAIHKGFYDIHDFFNTLSLNKVRLVECDGQMNEAENLEMLYSAFEEYTLNLGHYANYKKDCRRDGLNITQQDLEEEMRQLHDDTIPEEPAKTNKGTALVSNNNERTCKHCKQRGHSSAADPKCSKHDPS